VTSHLIDGSRLIESLARFVAQFIQLVGLPARGTNPETPKQQYFVLFATPVPFLLRVAPQDCALCATIESTRKSTRGVLLLSVIWVLERSVSVNSTHHRFPNHRLHKRTDEWPLEVRKKWVVTSPNLSHYVAT
jgi:hypothetical protein